MHKESENRAATWDDKRSLERTLERHGPMVARLVEKLQRRAAYKAAAFHETMGIDVGVGVLTVESHATMAGNIADALLAEDDEWLGRLG